MKRRTAAMFLGALICLSSLTGCGDAGQKESSEESGQPKQDSLAEESSAEEQREGEESSDASVAGFDFSEPVSFSCTSVSGESDFKSDDVYKLVAEKFNVDMEFMTLTWDNWIEKQRIWINSGDMPDVLMWDFNFNEYMEYAEEGQFKALPEDFEEKYPNLYATTKKSGLYDYIKEAMGGTLYGVPRTVNAFSESEENVDYMALVYRKDWAKQLGIEVGNVISYEDFLDMAKRFVTENPGGNGANRTIGFCGHPEQTCSAFVTPYNSNYAAFAKDEAGKYYAGFRDESTLEGIKSLWRSYQDGIIDPNFFSNNADEARNKFIAGQAGCYWQGIIPAILEHLYPDFKEANPDLDPREAICIAVVKGPDEKVHGFVANNWWTAAVFNPDMDDVTMERILAMMDFFCTEEGVYLSNLGIEGIDWERENGEVVAIEQTSESGDPIVVSAKYPSMGYFCFMGMCGDGFSYLNPRRVHSPMLASQQTNDERRESRADTPQLAAGSFIISKKRIAAERLPAVPLITCDPYFSLWSGSDALYDTDTMHWTGRRKRITGTAKIDGVEYRFLGRGREPAMEQIQLSVTAIHSIYRFRAAGTELSLDFWTPLLLDDLDVMSRPCSYLDMALCSRDGKRHEIELVWEFDGELCCDRGQTEKIGGGRYILEEMCSGEKDQPALRTAWMGLRQQSPLGHSGDSLTIDWGYLYLAAQRDSDIDVEYCQRTHSLRAKALFHIGEAGGKSASLIAAYDDMASINYFGRLLPGYWAREGKNIHDAISEAFFQHDTLLERCSDFEHMLEKETSEFGEAYTKICFAAYRQSVAAHKLIADEKGNPVFISKECHSGGFAATVDVTYPSTPLFFCYNPELVRGMMRPVLRFAKLPVWGYGFAPHDVGSYPYVTGQLYGLALYQEAAEDARVEDTGNVCPMFWQMPGSAQLYDLRYQMPMEECGNLLILEAMLARCNPEWEREVLAENLPLYEKWVEYLLKYGADPGEQLCTDDFAFGKGAFRGRLL